MPRKRPFFRSAAIYEFNGKLLINPYARTRDGVRTGMAVLATASKDDPRDVGLKLLAMLDKCKDNIPDDYDRGPSPALAVIVKEAKLRSWSAFHKKAISVGGFQETNGNQIDITPLRRVGGGSTYIDEKIRHCGLDPIEIGTTVLAAMAESE